MAVLVIGGGGFVGLNIVEQLLGQGESVTLFDLDAPPEAALAVFKSLSGELRTVTGDVCESSAVAAAITPDVDKMVYGAAVTAGTDRDREAPEKTLSVNLDGFMGALRAAHEAGLGRVINLSSSGAFGAAAFEGEGPLHEDEPAPDPRNIYAITKFASERVGLRMAEIWGLDVINVRLSGVFGRWERQTSVRDTPSPQFQILEALQSGKPAIVERMDKRDWIYATDVARAVHALLFAQSLQHRLYHISTGNRWSVLSWGQAMAAHFPGGECRLAERGETPNIALHAPTDRRPLSIDRLINDVGYQPRFDLKKSVEDYVAWSRST